MAKLILFRHARSFRNAVGTVQGSDPDPANTLDQKGTKQAFALGDLIVKRRITPTCVWSSPLPRARQTCDIVLGVMRCNLPVNEDPRLQEMCKGLKGLPGGMEGRRRDEVKTPAYREQYRQLGWDFRHGSLESHGETAREAGLRFLAALHMIADSLTNNARCFVFAHGQVIRYGIGAAFGFPDINIIDINYRLNNCESLIISRSAKKEWQFIGRMAAC